MVRRIIATAILFIFIFIFGFVSGVYHEKANKIVIYKEIPKIKYINQTKEVYIEKDCSKEIIKQIKQIKQIKKEMEDENENKN